MQSWNANTHHVIILPLIAYNLFHMDCKGGEGDIWYWFTDDLCFMTVDRSFVKLLMIVCGYFTADALILHYLVKDVSALTKLTKIHHFTATTGIMACFVGGYALPGIGNLLLLCEVSTVFINYRMLIPKENMGNFWPMINQLTFAFTYTVFRIILMPYVMFITIQDVACVWSISTII
jgi:hypothetical protein